MVVCATFATIASRTYDVSYVDDKVEIKNDVERPIERERRRVMRTNLHGGVVITSAAI